MTDGDTHPLINTKKYHIQTGRHIFTQRHSNKHIHIEEIQTHSQRDKHTDNHNGSQSVAHLLLALFMRRCVQSHSAHSGVR